MHIKVNGEGEDKTSDKQETFRDKETACAISASSKAGDALSSFGPVAHNIK